MVVSHPAYPPPLFCCPAGMCPQPQVHTALFCTQMPGKDSKRSRACPAGLERWVKQARRADRPTVAGDVKNDVAAVLGQTDSTALELEAQPDGGGVARSPRTAPPEGVRQKAAQPVVGSGANSSDGAGAADGGPLAPEPDGGEVPRLARTADPPEGEGEAAGQGGAQRAALVGSGAVGSDEADDTGSGRPAPEPEGGEVSRLARMADPPEGEGQATLLEGDDDLEMMLLSATKEEETQLVACDTANTTAMAVVPWSGLAEETLLQGLADLPPAVVPCREHTKQRSQLQLWGPSCSFARPTCSFGARSAASGLRGGDLGGDLGALWEMRGPRGGASSPSSSPVTEPGTPPVLWPVSPSSWLYLETHAPCGIVRTNVGASMVLPDALQSLAEAIGLADASVMDWYDKRGGVHLDSTDPEPLSDVLGGYDHVLRVSYQLRSGCEAQWHTPPVGDPRLLLDLPLQVWSEVRLGLDTGTQGRLRRVAWPLLQLGGPSLAGPCTTQWLITEDTGRRIFARPPASSATHASASRNHDWHAGFRFGEAQHPGPPRPVVPPAEPVPLCMARLPADSPQPRWCWLWVQAANSPPWYLISGGPDIWAYKLIELVAALVGISSRNLRLIQGGAVPIDPESPLGTQVASPVQVVDVQARTVAGGDFRPLAWLPPLPREEIALGLRPLPPGGIWDNLGSICPLPDFRVVLVDPDNTVTLTAIT